MKGIAAAAVVAMVGKAKEAEAETLDVEVGRGSVLMPDAEIELPVAPSLFLKDSEDRVFVNCEPWTFVAHWKHCESQDET